MPADATRATNTTSSLPAEASPQRRDAVDLLRGVVIVIMAIDHTRDYVHWAAMNFQPEDLTKTTAAIFFTRWITHFCAPAFMFCAGLGAWLRLERRSRNRVDGAQARSRPKAAVGELSRFLWTRGLWLILLEVTLVRLGFFFNVTYDMVFLLVFWALGLSMIALAALVYLPYRAVLAIGLAMIALHNLADGVRAQAFGSLGWIWNVLHQPGLIRANPPAVFVAYPIVPWIGVMALGFCAGRLYAMPEGQRRRLLMRLGFVATAAFVAIRFVNLYGDPRPWSAQSAPLMTVMSFLNCTKYPPSLLFLLMTLGPALLFLAAVDRVRVSAWNPFLVFGRTPLLFFVLHLPLIHAMQVGLTALTYGRAPFLFTPVPTLGTPRNVFPPDFGWNLWVVYAVWLAVLSLMYPICRWMMRLRQRRRSWWLSYL